MNQHLRKFIKGTANRLGLEINRRDEAQLAANPWGKKFGVFTDAAGNPHDLYDNYRRHTWPVDWHQMLRDREALTPENARRNGFVAAGQYQVDLMRKCLKPWGIELTGKRVLEVGCMFGGASVALVLAGAESVVACDVSAHHTLKSRPTAEEIAAQAAYLGAMRRLIMEEGALQDPRVGDERLEFRDVDGKDLRVEDDFDLIASWATLEHVMAPRPLFAATFAALRPGGYCAHIYHPFFCKSGAHHDCLDFPWGHVVLTDDDFRAYLQQYRPDELEIGPWRYFEALNRMTFATMREMALGAGFELVDFAPLELRRYDELPARTLALGKRNYPTLTGMDLLVENAFVLLRKPS